MDLSAEQNVILALLARASLMRIAVVAAASRNEDICCRCGDHDTPHDRRRFMSQLSGVSSLTRRSNPVDVVVILFSDKVFNTIDRRDQYS